MRNKIVPFYTEYKNTDQNFTLFIDTKTKRVFKGYHRKPNNLLYILAFVAVLAILKMVPDMQLSLGSPVIPLILLFSSFIISILVGRYCYKKFTYEVLQEISMAQSILDNYILTGKKVLKTEIWVVLINVFISIVLSLLFLLMQSLILYIFITACFSLIHALLSRFPKERFRLYRHRPSK